MVTVHQARELVKQNILPLSPVRMSLPDAVNLVLADNMNSRFDIPAFNQSSMDGYAFRYTDWKSHANLAVTDTIPAGQPVVKAMDQGHAVRIFTGAAVPDGADTVVMQEKTKMENGSLIILDNNLAPGTHIRLKGSEIKAGEMALEKLTLLTPAAIGFLAGIGVSEVPVYPLPSVGIIVTGNELQDPGKSLTPGQVYESSSRSLKAALQQLRINDADSCQVNDDPESLKKTLEKELDQNDLVLLTGGVSVGDYDFVVESAHACGVEEIFHGVNQKPGKPLFFGKKEQKAVFGLPGNPSSVLTCFYEYVIPALEALSNRKDLIRIIHAPLSVDYRKNPDLTFFLKGVYENGIVTPLGAQESYRMSSYARANCLVCLREGKSEFLKDEWVEIHLLPGQ